MKHVGCRLRTQFVCRKHIPNNITATLEQTAANVIPASVAYNPATKAYTATNGAMTAEANNSPASTEMEYLGSNFGRKYSYPSTSDYHYFLPTTESSKLKLTFVAGTVFWKPLAGTIPQLNTTLQMQAGKSYLVTIKLKPNYIYLMSDGTTGHFKETTFGGGSKTPIAVVVDETKHIAVALNDVGGGGNHLWAYGYSYQTNKVSTTTRPAKFGDYLSLENGYEETWDGNYTTALVAGEKVKGKRADFPAFKAAADYTPGVSVSGTMVGKKWYLPAMGEWGDMFVNLGFMKSYSSETNWGSTHWYGYLCSLAFTQVGGNFSTADAYWSSSEFENMTAGILIPGEVLIRWQAYTKSAGWLVRSFIRY